MIAYPPLFTNWEEKKLICAVMRETEEEMAERERERIDCYERERLR
jgi:hypothetical protein